MYMYHFPDKSLNHNGIQSLLFTSVLTARQFFNEDTSYRQIGDIINTADMCLTHFIYKKGMPSAEPLEFTFITIMIMFLKKMKTSFIN